MSGRVDGRIVGRWSRTIPIVFRPIPGVLLQHINTGVETFHQRKDRRWEDGS
jgi:hypothetical protein